ncbi:hypothetical protein [Thioclava sp. L04-15]|uniref:hypothetical protein n=1 Tax=Thioclava sp. L04-15 TaxID=1915318 RepID=UPI000996D0AD|nr:hypothetical protein [Thioclava sp. L04-15]TNE86216.1 MAG: hypothetical protein EP337_12060 [Paracoccaceae bacterium]
MAETSPPEQPTQAHAICVQQGFDPADALSTQFLLCENPAETLPGLEAIELDRFTLQLGREMPRVEMRDEKGRLFGVFMGIGVDPDGALITDGSFSRFNLDAKDFVTDLEAYIAYSAGRYAVVIDCPRAHEMLFDPVAHLSTVYDPETRRAASSVMLALTRPIIENPLFDTTAIGNGRARGDTEIAYLLGHSRDAQVKFCMPNHRLNLDSFTPERIWPLPDSFPPCAADEHEKLVAEMVERLRAILHALVDNHPSIMPISGGTDSRKLVACVTDKLDQIGELFAFQHTRYADLDATTGEYVVTELLGQPFRRYTELDAADHAAKRPFEKRQAKRLFWLRTSSVAPPPNEHSRGLTSLTPPGHLHLRGNVMDVMRGVWWGSFANRAEMVSLNLEQEIGSLFLTGSPSKEVIAKWAEEYIRWKLTLPENAQALVYDFIFLELFLHVSSAKYYGYERNFYICPFSDRKLIETSLRFPVEVRFAGTLNEMFLEAADPRLANQPYRGGVRDLIKAGKWTPKTAIREDAAE